MLASRLAGQPAIRRAFGAYTRSAGTSAPAEADPPTSMTSVTAGGEKAGLSTAPENNEHVTEYVEHAERVLAEMRRDEPDGVFRLPKL